MWCTCAEDLLKGLRNYPHFRRELPVETYGGVVGTDRCSSYTWLERRQLCWSHLGRDFQKILERGGDSCSVGWYLRVKAEYLLMKWARVRDGTVDNFEFLAEFPAVQTQIRHWLTTGLRTSSSRTTATCRRLLAADPDLLRFVSVPGLEPTNNSAERALRHPVIWRRNSHGTQSDEGSHFVERILTVVETCRQQQRPVFDFLRAALMAFEMANLPLHSYPLSNLKISLSLLPEGIPCGHQQIATVDCGRGHHVSSIYSSRLRPVNQHHAADSQ